MTNMKLSTNKVWTKRKFSTFRHTQRSSRGTTFPLYYAPQTPTMQNRYFFFQPTRGHRSFLVLLLLFCCHVSTAQVAKHTNKFQQWYKQYGFVFETILHTNCTAEYDRYRSGVVKDVDVMGGGVAPSSALTQPVIACILEHTGEYVKAQLSCAQVLLGVAPTILSIMGPRSDELSTLLVIGRRPLLFFLLACGCPSVYFGRAFEFGDSPTTLCLLSSNQDGAHDPQEDVLAVARRRSEYLPVSGLRRTRLSNAVATIAEYILAIAAVANIFMLCHDLGTRTVCIFWSSAVQGPTGTWVMAGIVSHLLGALTLRTRMRRLDHYPPSVPPMMSPDSTGTEFTKRNIRTKLWTATCRFVSKWVINGELKMTATQDLKNTQIQEFPESHIFIMLTWTLSILIISHVVFGTIVFSSLIFIGPEDALKVVIRYMASVMLCRMVLMYELAGLRDGFALASQQDVGVRMVSFSSEGVRNPCPPLTSKGPEGRRRWRGPW